MKNSSPIRSKRPPFTKINAVFKAVLLIPFLFFLSGVLEAQVTTNGGSGLAASYPSLAEAIDELNSATISSPVVITLTADETAPASGYMITASGTSTKTEWGVALLYANKTKGAQHHTIQNNAIVLELTYGNTFGIYLDATHAATVANVASETGAYGAYHGLNVYGNTIPSLSNNLQ
jgi:pyridoxine 5'-phosphate synthase PdxJ